MGIFGRWLKKGEKPVVVPKEVPPVATKAFTSAWHLHRIADNLNFANRTITGYEELVNEIGPGLSEYYVKSAFESKAEEALSSLRAASGYESGLHEEIEALEKELKELGAVKEYKQLTQREQTAIAFAAELSAETKKIIDTIDDLRPLIKAKETNWTKIKAKLTEIKKNIDEALDHLNVISSLVAQLLKIKQKMRAA